MLNWEELIYEGRNKAYGSYFLRKKQIKYLLIALFIAILFVCLPLLIYWYNVHKESEDLDLPESVPVILGHMEDFEKLSEPPPPPPVESTQKEPSNTIPVVKDSVLENKKPEEKRVTHSEDSIHLDDIKKLLSGNGSPKGGDSAQNPSEDQMPQYIGGYGVMNQYIQRNTINAVKLIKSGVREKMSLSFLVDKEGKVAQVVVLSGINPELDNAVIKVMSSMPKWIPGKRYGKPIPIRQKLTLYFNK